MKKQNNSDKTKFKEKINGLKKINVRTSLSSEADKLQSSGSALIITVLCALIFMFLICFAVFSGFVKGAEEVMVPEVKGKELTSALLEMQAKELYPKIQLRYSETPGDKGIILDQKPAGGAIVKAHRTINLVVSRGVIINQVEDYSGQTLDQVKMRLQTLFAGTSTPLINLAEPTYKPDTSPAGTILEQDPPAGTNISSPVTLNLIISKGAQYERTKVPDLIGMSVNDVLVLLGRSKLVFDFTSHVAKDNEKSGTIVSEQKFDKKYISNYTRMTADFAFPAANKDDDNVYGLFTATLPEYPYPVEMKIEAVPTEGDSYTLATFSHPGGNLTIPYMVPAGTVLILSVENKENSRLTVSKK